MDFRVLYIYFHNDFIIRTEALHLLIYILLLVDIVQFWNSRPESLVYSMNVQILLSQNLYDGFIINCTVIYILWIRKIEEYSTTMYTILWAEST
jgi:hypothetical protein